MRKYLALLLTLCMVFSVFSGLGIMASAGEPMPWNISARLAPSLTEEIPAANNAKAEVTMEDNVITITANVDELEESASSVPAQGTHKWIGLGINTGLDTVEGVLYNGGALTVDDQDEAKLVGLDDGEFILYIKADEVTPQNPKVITLGAEGHEDIELTIQVVTPWNIGARLAPSLTEEIPAANNAKAAVTMEDNVITITANVDELEESASSVPTQGTHKWIGLGIDTGLSDLTLVKYGDYQFTADDAAEAKLVGLDQDGEFILYIKADEVTPQNPKVITLGAEGHEDIELTIQVVKHTFVYTAKDNMLIETCIACDHYETATITAENTTYTGSAIENAKVTYSEGWQGGELTVVYENNKNVGTATAKITVDETTAKTTFSVYNRTSSSGGTVKLEPLEPQMSMLSEAIRGFIDIPTTAWYKDAASYVVEKGLMTGTSATTFAPGSTMTRAMLMTVLARNAGADTNGGTTWYEKGMAWAKENGISDGTNPTGNITREQLVTMLYRAAKEPKVSGELNFTDANTVSAYAQDAMRWAVANGIVTGMGDGTVAPTATATRAQVAAILMRYLEFGK